MDASAYVAGHDQRPLLRRGPLTIGAAVSLAIVVFLMPLVAIAAVLVGGTGIILAAVARDERSARRATTISSTGFGLTVGPFVYLLLWAAVNVF